MCWGSTAAPRSLVYIAASLLVALPIFFAESVIGRRSGRDTYGAMQLLAPGTAWKWAGLLTILSPLLILSYYSVVGGWSVEFLFKSLSFSFTEKAQRRYRAILENLFPPPGSPSCRIRCLWPWWPAWCWAA